MPAPAKTPARSLATIEPGREAPAMFRHSAISASGLRRCPLCGAQAIRDMYLRDLSETRVRLHLLCGECHTWRAVVAGPRRAEVLHNRLERRLVGDRREIQAAVWRAELGVEDADRPRAVSRR